MEIYLDNAATTRPYPEVVEVIAEALAQDYANPSSRHAQGRRARELVEGSRATVAEALGVDPDELYFTSGGTEANNLGILGACWAMAAEVAGRPARTDNSQRMPYSPGHVITSALEHPSVTKTIRNLRREGWRTSHIDAICGEFDLGQFEAALTPYTTMVSIMRVQNEMGFIFPLERIAGSIRERAPFTLLHVDAVQTFGKLPFSPRELGCDLCSVSAHKIGGPKGIGALYVRRGVPMYTIAHGGGQERQLRSGTEATPLIAGFAEAVRVSFAARERNLAHVSRLSEALKRLLRQGFDGVIVNSRDDGSPYIVNFTLPGIGTGELVGFLSERGICASVASACESGPLAEGVSVWRPKRPLSLIAAGVAEEDIANTLRVSFAPDTTMGEVERLIAVLKEARDLPSARSA